MLLLLILLVVLVVMLNFLVEAGKEMGRRAYDGLLLDAANTLLQLTKPVEETYAVIGKKYGVLFLPLIVVVIFHFPNTKGEILFYTFSNSLLGVR